MGHWEQTGVENRKERERRAHWPRWRRELYRRSGYILAAVCWAALAALLFNLFGVI